MSQYRKSFQAGYEEGYLIGKIEAELGFVKSFVKRGYVQNYEDAMRVFEVEESVRARLMDYIYFKDAETWGPLSDEGWEEREKLIEKVVKEKINNKGK